VWKRLNHPNVLPTLGAGPDIAELCVVSPWMPDGHLLQYLKKYPGAPRVSIVSVHGVYDNEFTELDTHKMLGAVDGLSYLHFNDVVHGDLKGVSDIDQRGSIG
jgi:serine/threonine protein kinase